VERPDTRGWLKVKPAAKYAGVSERTIRSWLKAGLPHSRMLSGTILIAYADLDEYIRRFESTTDEVGAMVDSIPNDLKR